MVNNQLYRVGEKDHHENMFEVESPFVSRWDKVLGRTSSPDKYPFFIIKESSYSNCAMGKIDFSEREEIFKTQFGERYTAHKETENAKMDLLGKVVQINIRDNVSQAFDE